MRLIATTGPRVCDGQAREKYHHFIRAIISFYEFSEAVCIECNVGLYWVVHCPQQLEWGWGGGRQDCSMFPTVYHLQGLCYM